MKLNKMIIVTLILVFSLSAVSFADNQDTIVKSSTSKIQLNFTDTQERFVILSQNDNIMFTKITESNTITICNLDSGEYYDIKVIEYHNDHNYSIKTKEAY